MTERIVVKLGTSVLTGGTPRLDQPKMVDLVRQCAELHERGTNVLVCSSGAIAVGRGRLGFPDLADTITTKQMLAAVGQSRLMLMWERLFEIYGITVGQVLLTRADMEDRRRYLNAQDTLAELISNKIVPVVNENDAVATEEIKFGDNDNLSALLAILTEADLLLMLTDQPGLFTADPRMNPNAELIPEVREIDEEMFELAGGSVSGLGVGGMTTKLQAADLARRAGTTVVVASGKEKNVILRVSEGERVGTTFPALENPLESRKRWILAGTQPAGRVIIDEGAVRALRDDGRSLLPAGLVGVQGGFERGDTVFIFGPDGDEVGRGIARYSSGDLERIAGCHSDDIDRKLGYDYGAVAVHRDDMILL